MTAQVAIAHLPRDSRVKVRISYLDRNGRILATYGRIAPDEEAAEAMVLMARKALKVLGIEES